MYPCWGSDTHTCVPSDQALWQKMPTEMLWMNAPVEASNSVTVPELKFDSHTWVPSELTPPSPNPGLKMFWTIAPVEASSSTSVWPKGALEPLPRTTQTWVPSEETLPGWLPTGMV